MKLRMLLYAIIFGLLFTLYSFAKEANTVLDQIDSQIPVLVEKSYLSGCLDTDEHSQFCHIKATAFKNDFKKVLGY